MDDLQGYYYLRGEHSKVDISYKWIGFYGKEPNRNEFENRRYF